MKLYPLRLVLRLIAGGAALFLTAFPAAAAQPDAARRVVGNGSVTISGELKQWHAVTLDLAGPQARETDTAPNPFTDYRFDVVFEHESGTPRYRVPGYFAADGNAAESGADAGHIWRAHLSPDRVGEWSYRISFVKGAGVAITDAPSAKVAPYDGTSGTFRVGPTNKFGRDFRGQGRLSYVGRHHLQFAGTGEYFLKAGADSPETFLAYTDFDNTLALKPNVPLKTWGPHVRDWREGDPTWRGGRGKGMIGALNYLASKGVNAFSFLPYNAGGDGDNVWPFVARDAKFHYDCSKLDQWGVIFAHAQTLGLYLHFKLQETEIDDQRRRRGDQIVDYDTPADGAPAVPEALDGGALGPERKLYLRELIARFGHHLALNWNLGEENTQTSEEQRAMAQYIADTDPYGHHRVIHTYPNMQERVYEPLLGHGSTLTGASLQNMWNETHARTVHWVRASAATGRPWVVANDEQGSARTGVPPDPGYEGFDGIATEEGYEPYDLHGIRRYTLWGNLMGGGAGVEYYFGYRLPENDLIAEDFRSRDRSWDYCRIALEFFHDHNIPFWEMRNANPLVGNHRSTNDRYCLASPSELYLVYLPEGGAAPLDLSLARGEFSVAWFNPREGGPLTPATIIGGGQPVQITAPSEGDDWLAVVRRQRVVGARSLRVGPTPESVVRGFDGKLYVTLMGIKRERGDGDGKIVVVDGDRVSDFATGLDDPKGIVFVGGRLITTDFDKVWAFDAHGDRTLLAGPDDFPARPRFLNDVAVEAGGRSILVTDMGDLASMHSSPGVFWPLDSEEARNLQPLGRVYRVTLDGKVSVAIDHDPAMPNPNGVDALDDGRILIAEFFRGTLLEWNRGVWREIASGHRSGDGIVHDRAGNLYLSEVRSGRVWRIEAASGQKQLLGTLQSAADHILDEARGELIVPDSKAGTLVFIPVPPSTTATGKRGPTRSP
jgi:sugar lactone lactonase YvrE